MNPRIEKNFHEVVDLPAAARAKYFTEHPVDSFTRQEVEALRAFDKDSSFSLEGHISNASMALTQLDPRGWRCGPYRLLKVIGRGGIGAVYLAERTDGEVVQRVAVKLLPPGAGRSNWNASCA